MVAHFSWCKCGYTIEDLTIHLLPCLCGSECIVAHDTLWENVVAIALYNGPHVQRKVSPPFPLPNMEMSGYSHHQKIIFGPWWMLSLSIWFIQFGVTCFNDNNICNNNCHSRKGVILPKTSAKRRFYSFNHQNLCFDSFFISCVHANITCHQQTFLVPSTFICYYRQQISIAFQYAQAIVIF